MRRIYSIIGLLVLTITLQAQVDDDPKYLNPVFDEIEVMEDLTYGANYTVLFKTVVGTTVLVPLQMDVYTPAGDTATDRPLAIVLHTGNFLPIQVNGGLLGTKRDSSTTYLAEQLARHGYVVASIDYRLGWNPLAETQAERAFGLINAAYRGVQDTRTAVRFFKKSVAEQGNPFGIDSSKVVVWGQGTGGYIALAVATLDDPTEIVTTTMPEGKFVIQADGTPVPMVVNAINGDIFGTSLGLGAPGSPFEGDTLAIAKHVDYNWDISLAVNMGGALGDISWIDENTPPIIAYQVPLDPFAPYESQILVVPTTMEGIVEVQGSFTTMQRVEELGLNDVYDEVNVLDEAAQEASQRAGHEYIDGLYPFTRGVGPNGFIDASPWNWWNPEMWDTITNPATGLSFHQTALLSNPEMSPEKGRSYIDTAVWYFAPRAFEVLFQTIGVEKVQPEEVGLKIVPNPVMTEVRISADETMERLTIFDVQGKVVLQKTLPYNTTSYTIERNGQFAPGTYFLEVLLERGRTVEKLMFK